MAAVDQLLGAIRDFVKNEGGNPKFRNVITELKTVTVELGTVAPIASAPSPGARELNRVTGRTDDTKAESPAEERRETPGAEAAEGDAPDEPKTFAGASAAARERMSAAQ